MVVEAAAAGLPLVLSELPVFREHFAEGAILAPSRGELANAVRRLAVDQEFHADRARAARTIARRFSAASSAEVLFALAPEPAHRRRPKGEEPP